MTEGKKSDTLLFRLATLNDLGEVKALYQKVVKHMIESNLLFWNEHYPVEVVEEDIQKSQLYLLCEEGLPLCACAVYPAQKPFEGVYWQDSPALYMWRLAVHPEYLRKGLAKTMVENIKNLAKEQGYPLLRLLVVDCNRPAHDFYQSLGFKRKEGRYQDLVNGQLLTEYGYECEV